MADKDKEKNNPNLGCLEEDDEFEEFPVEGKNKEHDWFLFPNIRHSLRPKLNEPKSIWFQYFCAITVIFNVLVCFVFNRMGRW